MIEFVIILIRNGGGHTFFFYQYLLWTNCVRPSVLSSPTAPVDPPTTDASRAPIAVLSSDSFAEDFCASKEEAEDAYDLAKDSHVMPPNVCLLPRMIKQGDSFLICP